MKVLFVCGSYPPDNDSNADTAKIMVDILEARGIAVDVLSNIDWTFGHWPEIKRRIKSSNADVIHIQYPGLGYKYSITPQMLSFFYRKKTIVTIHEVSQAQIARQLSLLPFSFCKKIALTNVYELNYFKKIFPWAPSQNAIVVPIGSNIDCFTNLDFEFRKTTEIIHFGQIRPQKGIEQVIELAELIKERNLPFKVTIMGRTYNRFESFYDEMRNKSELLPLQWLLNESEEVVSNILGSNVIAYLPYPDGVTERRGSMFASMVHNMVVFTTKSEQTPVYFDDIVMYMKTPRDMAAFLASPALLSDLLSLHAKFKNNVDVFMKKYSWDSIMDEYIKLYREIKN